MKREWALSNEKVIINFSQNYCNNEEEVLESEGFRSVLEHYLTTGINRESKMYNYLISLTGETEIDPLIREITRIAKLLTIMDVEEISENFEKYRGLKEQKIKLNKFIEEVYTFWRNLERYAIIHDVKVTEGFINSSLIQAKERFDKLMIGLYRKISDNITMTNPNVYRQLPAGTNAGMIVYDAVWPVPIGYEILENIPFVKEIVIESPFITYPKKNKRDGFFYDLDLNPLRRCGINSDKFFCFPIMVGPLLTYVFVERDFITHGVSLANLFEIPRESEISGKRPDLIYIMGAEDHRGEDCAGYYEDKENDLWVGYASKSSKHDYFGYMKKMVLTLHNLYQIKKGALPIHGAMVHIELKDGSSANVVIVGDSGAGKSESIEAFRALAKEHISFMSIIFDDMGTFKYDADEEVVKAYGTEIGAFVRLDDLEAGYAFKELDRSIFMNPDKINARLVTPVSTYDEIMEGLEIDMLLYANNYDSVPEGESAVELLDDLEEAKEIFIGGRRMAKGTTTETGISTSFFANPFGPHQREEKTREIIDDIFEKLQKEGVKIGTLYTQLGIEGLEQEGARRAAVDLFEAIKELED